MADKKILTVTQLNMYVKSLLESSVYLKDVYISGEISNFTNHYKTGHLYMSLKDDTGVIKAVMFRQYATSLKFKPENGMKVICRGRVSLYERDGVYQMYITDMQPQGVGALALAYEQLKSKLQAEGLFDEKNKKPIPKMPSKIAVITSPTGAAVQDILNILGRRYPVAQVIMCPVQVQGDVAAPQMIEALKTVNDKNCADVIIIGRGGGSIEDLWAFNDETLARTVAASKIPVISAVGHETDFTICDFAADLRAPTPSGAAELAVPDKHDLKVRIDRTKITLKTSLNRVYQQKQLQLKALLNKQCMANPLFSVNQRQQSLDMLCSKLKAVYTALVEEKKRGFMSSVASLDALSPLAVLLRGYSLILKDNQVISSAKALKSGDEVNLKLSDGLLNAVVK